MRPPHRCTAPARSPSPRSTSTPCCTGAGASRQPPAAISRTGTSNADPLGLFCARSIPTDSRPRFTASTRAQCAPGVQEGAAGAGVGAAADAAAPALGAAPTRAVQRQHLYRLPVRTSPFRPAPAAAPRCSLRARSGRVPSFEQECRGADTRPLTTARTTATRASTDRAHETTATRVSTGRALETAATRASTDHGAEPPSPCTLLNKKQKSDSPHAVPIERACQALHRL